MPLSFGYRVMGLAISTALLIARSGATSPRSPDEPAARAVMVDVERAQRGGQRMFSMDLSLTYAARHTGQRRMLAVTRSDTRETQLLYVVMAPQNLQGSTLLIHDSKDPRVADRIWICLPSLHTFREVEASSMSLLVPGTGMTYEDSRGWIATDRYRFRTIVRGPEELTIEAIPRTDSLVDIVGSARLLVRVEPARHIVTGVVFYDRAGNLTRSYEAADFTQVGGRWLPAHVTTEQRVQLLVTRISYRYADLPETSPENLFRAAVGPVSFLERLINWRDRMGLAATFPDSGATR